MSASISKHAFRLMICMLISLAFGFLVSEGSFWILSQGKEIETQDVIISIPKGTAERIEKGLAVPSIPDNIVFYQGDRIIVNNEDQSSHQLGPIWVPAESQGILTLQDSEAYTLACTFTPQKVMGIEVRKRITSYVRFQGLLAIGIPSGILIFLFSLVIFPIRQEIVNSGRNDEPAD